MMVYLGPILAPLVAVLGAFLSPLGAILGPSEASFWPSWALLRPPGGHHEANLAHPEGVLGHLGAISSHLGANLGQLGPFGGHVGALWAPSCASLRPCWCQLSQVHLCWELLCELLDTFVTPKGVGGRRRSQQITTRLRLYSNIPEKRTI